MFPDLDSRHFHENRYVTRRSVDLSLSLHYLRIIYLFSRKLGRYFPSPTERLSNHFTLTL
jgi:hypothetical protein